MPQSKKNKSKLRSSDIHTYQIRSKFIEFLSNLIFLKKKGSYSKMLQHPQRNLINSTAKHLRFKILMQIKILR